METLDFLLNLILGIAFLWLLFVTLSVIWFFIQDISTRIWLYNLDKEYAKERKIEADKDYLIQLKISKTHSQEEIENFLITRYGVKTISELESENYKEVLNFLEKL